MEIINLNKVIILEKKRRLYKQNQLKLALEISVRFQKLIKLRVRQY
jgi:hypothetical protein